LRDPDLRLGRIPLWKFLAIYALLILIALPLWPVFLRSWFARPPTALTVTQEVTKKAIVSGFRRIAACNGCAPTAKTSDEKIMEIYCNVVGAFRGAEEQRGEHIPADCLHTITMEFLRMHEDLCEAIGKKAAENFMQEHLSYEIDKYLAEGLRPGYRRELPLF
jgi:hypothetical protein